MKKLDDILGTTKQIDPPGGLRLPPLSHADWEHAVGARIAARTEPYRLERGVLSVRVATAAWANELAMLSTPIIEHLRKQGLAVDTVRFAVGPVQAPQRPRGAPIEKPVPPLDALPEDLEGLVASIESPDLRAAVARAALQTLGRRGVTADGASRGEDANAGARATRSESSPDRAQESPTPGPVSPSPPPVSVTRLTPRKKKG